MSRLLPPLALLLLLPGVAAGAEPLASLRAGEFHQDGMHMAMCPMASLMARDTRMYFNIAVAAGRQELSVAPKRDVTDVVWRIVTTDIAPLSSRVELFGRPDADAGTIDDFWHAIEACE